MISVGRWARETAGPGPVFDLAVASYCVGPRRCCQPGWRRPWPRWKDTPRSTLAAAPCSWDILKEEVVELWLVPVWRAWDILEESQRLSELDCPFLNKISPNSTSINFLRESSSTSSLKKQGKAARPCRSFPARGLFLPFKKLRRPCRQRFV